MTPAGFPHSDICGSKLSRQLPAAFRSQTRPSSAPDAKASTVSPYSLDYRCSRSLSSSQGARGFAPSKLNSVPADSVSVSLRSRSTPSARCTEGVLTGGGCRLPPTGPVLSTWSLPDVSTRIGRPHAPVCQRLLRKEVIQPQLPLRLPCYDFTPIASPTFDGSLLTVRPPASGVAHFRGVTGGVYKARERIHRSNADLRLLATPTSRGRVADLDPN